MGRAATGRGSARGDAAAPDPKPSRRGSGVHASPPEGGTQRLCYVSKYQIGDMVVLTSGSMRMAVESIEDETVNVVWCHEGKVGRDAFSEKLLNKWEMREADRAPRPSPSSSFNDRGPRPGGFGGGDRGDRGPRPGGFGGGDKGGDRGPRSFGGDKGGDRGPRSFGGDKGGDRAPRSFGGDKGGDRPQGDRPQGDRPQGGGWNKDRAPAGPSTYDGRPREKKFFRKDT